MKSKLVVSLEKLFAINQPYEEEKARLGHLFNALMVISIGIVITLSIAFLLMKPLGLGSRWITTIAAAFPSSFIPLSIFCMILTHRGHIKLSINLYVLINFFTIGLAAYLFDGLASPAWSLYIWTITIAGTLLAPINSLGMMGTVLIYFLSLAALSKLGIYTPPLTFGNQGREFVDIVCLLIMLISSAGLLTYLNMRNLHQAFGFLRNEIADHRRAEDELRRMKEEWERTFNTVPDLIVILDRNFRIVRSNASLDKRLNLPQSMCIGQTCYSLIHNMNEPPPNCPHAHLLRDGKEHSGEVIEERLGGAFVVTDTPLYDGAGELIGSVHVAHDITESKQAEAVLRASEIKYRTLVETSPNGITLADLDGKILFCNQQAARLYGYDTPKAMYGMNVKELIVPVEHALVEQNTQKLLEEGNIKNAEYTMVRKDGSNFPAETNASIFRDVDRNTTNIIAITQDITERKRAREEEKLLIMMKEEFISSISHDLRTPLFTLMGYLDLLRKGKVIDSKVQNEFLNRAAEDVNRLLDMVNELLDISRLESDHLVLNWEEVDLGLVISKVVQSFLEQAQARHISLTSTPTIPSLIAEVDPARIRRVVTNLLENAIKFSDSNGEILVFGEKENGNISIHVIDHGCGISVEDCSKVFDKFYQVTDIHKRNSFGRGLGLYISKQIIDAHGGTIQVKSQLGLGSKFTVSIPVKKRM